MLRRLRLFIISVKRMLKLGKQANTGCCHNFNWVEERTLSEDGTPMVHFTCYDCGFESRGHVHADPATWVGTTYCSEGFWHKKEN